MPDAERGLQLVKRRPLLLIKKKQFVIGAAPLRIRHAEGVMPALDRVVHESAAVRDQRHIDPQLEPVPHPAP
jgi:hypothetical protein